MRELAGKKSEDLRLFKGTKVPQVLQVLADRYGSGFRELLYSSEGDLAPNVTILVNGTNVAAPSLIDTELKNDDELVVLPPLAGGFGMGSQGRVYVETYGCSASISDSEIIKGLLVQEGYILTDRLQDAHANVIVTCSVKDATAQRMRHRVKYLTSTGKPLVIAGCMPKTEKTALERLSPSASMIGPDTLSSVVLALRGAMAGRREVILAGSDQKPSMPRVRMNRCVEIVQISQGCLSACSFCQVKMAKGTLRSFSIGDICNQIMQAVNDGVKEVWLTSTDCGCYGFDRFCDLADLLMRVELLEGDFKVRVGMMSPVHMRRIHSRLAKAFLGSKLFKFIHLPVQSGSDSVLKSMRRCHTADEYVRWVDAMRSAIPHLTLSTDVIVGYPTETDEDFAATLDLLNRVKPDVVNISKFSSRPGTSAQALRPLPPSTVNERSAKMHQIAKSISLERNKAWIGWRGKVLVDEVIQGAMIGRNFAYKPVLISEPVSLGSMVDVEVHSVTSYTLRGRLLI